MERARPEPLFTPAVICELFAHAIGTLQQPDNHTSHWDAYTLGRFAAWVAAIEGAIEVIPDVLDFLSRFAGDWTDTYADYYGPLHAVEALIAAADPPDAIFAHASARVRHKVANCAYAHRGRLANDRDAAVRAMARYCEPDKPPSQPWWVGVLPERPPDRPEVLKFGTLVRHLWNPRDWSHAEELAEAFSALAPDFSGRIAPLFLTPLWGGSAWAQPVWNALLHAPSPLAERRRLAEQAIGELMLPCGFPREHYEAIERAIGGCSSEEQGHLAVLLALPGAHLERPRNQERHARWAARPRRQLGSRAGPPARSAAAELRAVPLPPGLLERLVHEIVRPGSWGQDRIALHPRARWELGRGFRVLDVRAVENRQALLLELADVAALAREERPNALDATQLALIGLLGAVEATDPIFTALASDSNDVLREAAALGLAGTGSPIARRLLEDGIPEVWTAARIATPDAEPWRGPLAKDPFAGCSDQEAEELVGKLVELEAALPRVRYHALQEADFVRLGAIVASLPAPHGLTLAFRLLPARDLDSVLGPLIIAIVNTEGGWAEWVAMIARRMKHARAEALSLGGPLVRLAALAEDGGIPIPRNPERRWAAACDALARHARTPSEDHEVAEMWLRAAASLWPNDRDPLPLPGVWRAYYPDYCVRERLGKMSFGPDWPVTQTLLEGARNGYARPWGSWSCIADLIARLPESARDEVVLEGYWRDGDFGQWARQRLGEQLSRARIVDQTVLHALLADPRLAPARLVQRDRTKHTLFVRRARLAAGLADFAEGLSTVSAIAAQVEAEPWTADEVQGWRSRWMEAIQQAMAAGPGGPRGVFVTLAPPGLWEEIDRAFVHAVAHDATPEEAAAIARRLAMCGDAEDVATVHELAERHPTTAPWPELLKALSAGGAHRAAS